MPTAITTSGETLRSAVLPTVYLREFWSQAWVEQEHLYCDWATDVAAPSIPTAAFTWQYGVGMRQGELSMGQVSPLDKLKHWIKVSSGDFTWYGRIDEDQRAPDGAPSLTEMVEGDPVTTRIPTGRQGFLAYGLLETFNRQRIRSSRYQLRNGVWSGILGTGLEFNAENKFANTGNRSAVRGPDAAYVFAEDLDAATYWSTANILEHLLKFYGAVNQIGFLSVPVRPHGGDLLHYAPDWDRPKISTEGRTLKEAIDALLNRRRGMSYRLEVSEGTGPGLLDEVVVRPFNFRDVPYQIDVGEVQGWLRENTSQITVDFDQVFSVESARVRQTTIQKYDQVVAAGDRILACGTFSALDGTITAHWSAADEAEYNDPTDNITDPTDYDDMDRSEKILRLDAYRSREELATVYRDFGLPADWTDALGGFVADGEDGAANPLLSVTFPPFMATAPWYTPHLRFERELPLKTRHDYSGSRIASQTVVNNTPAGQAWEYRPIYALMKLNDDDITDRYTAVDKMSIPVEGYGRGEGRDFSVAVRAQQDRPGVTLNVSGAPQHAIATADWTPLADEYEQGEFDWHDNLIVTAAMRSDVRYLKAVPAQVFAPEDALRILWIDVGEDAQYHYVAPGTVVGELDGVLVRSTGGAVRDDGWRLTLLAEIAWNWYGATRQTLDIAFNEFTTVFTVGDLIVSIGADETLETINTVITEIRYDWPRGEQEIDSTTIQTSFAELDVLKIV